MTKRYTLLILLVLSIGVYLNTLTHGFVYDDIYFSNRRDLSTFVAIPRAFVESYLPNNRNAGFYRPLPIASFALTYTMFGNSAFPFHLTNIVLHTVATILVLLIGRTLKLPYLVALMAAILFAVHPVHVDAVASIKGRDEIFYAIFLLISWWAFIKASESKARFFLFVIISVVSYLLALFSKEMAITIPFVSIFSLGIVRMPFKKIFIFLVGWGLASMFYLSLRYIALGSGVLGAYGTIFPAHDLYISTVATRIFTGLHIYFLYLRTLFFPLHLSATYGYAQVLPITNPFNSWFWLPGLLAGILTTLCLGIAIKGKKRLFSVLIACWIVLYLPASQFLGVKGDVAAERWMYTPSIVVFLLVSFILVSYIRNRKYLQVFFVVIMLALAMRTIIRNRVWATNFSIYSSMVVTAPKSVHAQTAMALEYFKKREFDLAKKHAEIALGIYRDYPQLMNVLGNIATMERKYDLAQKYYEKSLKLMPDYIQTYIYLAGMNFSKGDFEKAREYYELVLRQKSFFSYEDIIGYAAALAKLKKYQESLAVLGRLNEDELKKTQTQFLLAVNYYKLGEKEKVLEHFRWNGALSRDEREKILKDY